MRKYPNGAAWGIGLYIIVMFLVAGQANAATEHNGQTWQGSQNCLTCHKDEALEMHGSSHYQWQGQASGRCGMEGSDLHMTVDRYSREGKMLQHRLIYELSHSRE